MTLARWLENIFVGQDKRESLDREIAIVKANAINDTQAVKSGARLVQHMSGMLQIVAESQHAKQ